MFSYDFLWFPSRDKPGTTQGRPDKIAHMWLSMICMVSYAFLWFLMISHDFFWVPMISNDFVWFLMISMLPYDSLWFPMISYDFLWFSMISYDCFHIISYDFLWFPIRNNPGTTHGRPNRGTGLTRNRKKSLEILLNDGRPSEIINKHICAILSGRHWVVPGWPLIGNQRKS